MDPASIQDVAGLAAAMFRAGMAIVFAIACAAALRDPPAHAATVAAYRLLPERGASAAALLLALANGATAGLLAFGAAPGAASLMAPAGSVAACALLLLYAAAMQINLVRGRAFIACGCGGTRGQTISSALVLRNGLLALCLAASIGISSASSNDPVSRLVLVCGAISIALLHFAASQLLANKSLALAAHA